MTTNKGEKIMKASRQKLVGIVALTLSSSLIVPIYSSSAAVIASKSLTKNKITLNMYQYESNPGQPEALASIAKNFTKKYPNITVKIETKAYADYSKTLSLRARSSNAPDIMEIPQGQVGAVPLSKAGLIQNLDNYSKLYGWDKKLGGGLASNSVTADLKSYGSGTLRAVPLSGQVVGVFYNKKLAAEYGLSVPFASLADFEAGMAKIKAMGKKDPLIMGSAKYGMHTHNMGVMLGSYTSKASKIQDWIFGASTANINTKENREALETMQRWTKLGYTNDQPNALGYEDAVAKFYKGDGVFFLTGSWLTSGVQKELGDNGGFFLLPRAKSGTPFAGTGSVGTAMGISSKSKYPNEAAAFIDFLAGGNSATILDGAGWTILAGKSTNAQSVVQKEVIAAFQTLVKNNSLTYFLDWSTPAMLDKVILPLGQELIDSKITASLVLQAMQDNWEEFHLTDK